MAAMAALNIPQVTEDDLASFHTHHFDDRQQGFPSTLLSATIPEAALLREGCYEDRDLKDNYDDDDGLGYYPDGVKRTLTDAQIAMFRWSEVQGLLRAKRRRLGDLGGGRRNEGCTESKEKRQIKRESSSSDGSEAEGETQSLEKRKERIACGDVIAESFLGPKRRKKMESRGSYDENPPAKRDLHLTTGTEENTLNYDDDAPHHQDQASTGNTLADEGEDEGEYEKFLAKERDEFGGASSPERRTDLIAEKGAKGDPNMGGISLAGLDYGGTEVEGRELVQQSISTAKTQPTAADINNKPSASPALEPQWSSNGAVLSGNATGGTTQPVHSRRRIFYGDDEGDDADKNRPVSAASTAAVAAGGVTKGEKRAFLWPKIGGR